MSLSHIAMIMDGNGRWATNQGLKRVNGHEKGAEVVRKITTYCSNLEEVSYLTLYAFSTENWKRPKLEVEFLMKLLDRYLKNELETYQKNGVKFTTIGNLEPFSKSLRNRIDSLKEATKHNTKLTQVLALNYGSMDEITRTTRFLQEKNIPITQEAIESNLDSAGIPPVDILIRTGGDYRLSNYLLWQSAYAELFFIPTLWPDLKNSDLDTIINEFHTRERRFGGI
jgi:undecaprenyl diphosphate synthase